MAQAVCRVTRSMSRWLDEVSSINGMTASMVAVWRQAKHRRSSSIMQVNPVKGCARMSSINGMTASMVAVWRQAKHRRSSSIMQVNPVKGCARMNSNVD